MIFLKQLSIAAAQADPSPGAVPTVTQPNLEVPRSSGALGRVPSKLRIGLVELAATATIEIWALVESPAVVNLGETLPADRRYILAAPAVALSAADPLTDVAGLLGPGAYRIRVVASTANATLVVAAV